MAWSQNLVNAMYGEAGANPALTRSREGTARVGMPCMVQRRVVELRAGHGPVPST